LSGLISTLSKDLQPAKAELFMTQVLAGKETFFKEIQPWNAVS
jgi:hypothetical protein